MLGEPLHSPYDVSFVLWGFRVRVTWLFWVIIAALGYNGSVDMHEYLVRRNQDSPGMAVFLLLWVGVVFVSILWHELGHAFAMRYYDIDSYIVLYHMGGLAIPSVYSRYTPGRQRRMGYGPVPQLVISAAGPAVQLALAAVVLAAAYAMGYRVYGMHWIASAFGRETIAGLNDIANPAVEFMLTQFLFVNIWWALVNLLPVLPLDGGRIAQHLLALVNKRDCTYEATTLSIVVAFLFAMWGYTNGDTYVALMFLFLGITNLQNLRGGIHGY
jgi:stage IV sporulation protein FB